MKDNAGVSCEDELKKIKVNFQAGKPETAAKSRRKSRRFGNSTRRRRQKRNQT